MILDVEPPLVTDLNTVLELNSEEHLIFMTGSSKVLW